MSYFSRATRPLIKSFQPAVARGKEHRGDNFWLGSDRSLARRFGIANLPAAG